MGMKSIAKLSIPIVIYLEILGSGVLSLSPVTKPFDFAGPNSKTPAA